MSRQVNQSLSVIALLFISAAVVFFVYQDHKSTIQKKKTEEKAKLVFQLDSKLDPSETKDRKKLIADVSRLEIFNDTLPKGKQNIVLARDKSKHWVVEQPITTPADESEIKHLLQGVLKAKADQTVLTWKEKDKKPTKELTKYGLNKPKHKLTFTFRKLTHTVWLGDKNPFNSKYYAYLPDRNKVVMVGSSLHSSLNKKLFDLRRKEIFTQNIEGIQTFSVTRKRNQLAFEKREVDLHAPIVKTQKDDHGHGHDHHGHSHGKKKVVKKETRWYMTLPLRAWASKSDVNSLLSSLRYLKATKFVSEDVKKDAKKYGLDQPRITVEVTMANGKSMALNINTKKVGKKTKAYAASAAGGPIAEISDYILKDLEKSAFAYRDTKVIRFKSDHVFSIRYGTPKQMYSLLKMVGQQKGWRIFNPSPQRASSQKIRAMLNQLHQLKAKKFVKEDATAEDLKTHGLDTPQRTYTLYGRSKKDLLGSVYVGNKTKDGYMVTNKDKKQIMLVKAKDINQLPTADWQVIPGGKAPKPKTTTRTAPRKAPATRKTTPRTAPAPAPAPRVTPRGAPTRPAPTQPAPTRRAAPAPAPAPRRDAAPAPAPRREAAPAPRREAAPAPAPVPAPRRDAAPALRRDAAPAPARIPAPAPRREAAPAPVGPMPPAPAPTRAAPKTAPASRPAKRGS